MKRITLFLLTALTPLVVNADNHAEKNQAPLPMAIFSTYEIPGGGSPSAIQAALTEYLKAEEAAGYDDCTMYQHQFGAQRGFYTSCVFKDLDHFAEIVDGGPQPVVAEDDTQLFGAHSDHIVSMTSRGMTERPKHILFATTTFSPTMTYSEMVKSADLYYGVYEEAFARCNRYEHAWGPEMAFYITCGFDNYAAFSKSVKKLMPLFIRKADHFIFNRRAVAGAHTLNFPRIHR